MLQERTCALTHSSQEFQSSRTRAPSFFYVSSSSFDQEQVGQFCCKLALVFRIIDRNALGSVPQRVRSVTGHTFPLLLRKKHLICGCREILAQSRRLFKVMK